MTELDQKISAAYQSEGKQEDVNQVYLTLLGTVLFVPVQKEKAVLDDEPFRPLFANIDGNYFLIAFDTADRLKGWAQQDVNNIAYVELSGRDMLAGMNDNVYLALNVGTEFYKEFSPDEVKQIKKIISKIDQFKLKAQKEEDI
ncbi:MAG: SseB family protein [Gammaproteobacteria bacterium]|nr:SseB family protein [Gammaproteobacteria bacterium]